MRQTTGTVQRYETGDVWLADGSARPDPVHKTWAGQGLAPVASGSRWLVVEAPLLRSVEAIARIGGDRIGPILGDIHRRVAWWLVPPALAGELDGVRELTVRPAGWALECPPVRHSVAGRWWIERPDGSDLLTDPAALADAFGAGHAPSPTEVSR
ncbi:hypothetical protein [Streptomyces sp. NPDC047042]|uniref:hypothetical protein n=1 Tax=Streptomyces sp. NPDC047042 TaxID=3154807 RepID=UPI0033E9312E